MYNVLVCDDEKDIVSALQIYLKSEGYQVFSAYNGKEALKIINREDIQLGQCNSDGYYDAGNGRDRSDVQNP